MNDFTTARKALFTLMDSVDGMSWEVRDGQIFASFPIDPEAETMFDLGRQMFTPR